MAVQFDPFNEANVATALGLVQAFHQEESRTFDKHAAAAVRQIARGEPFARGWLLRQQGEAVGYIILTLGFSIEYGGRDGFIDDLYLLPAVRGQGLGRQLFEFALARARDLGIRTLHLEVETDNEPAIRLYRSQGFQETGRRLMRLSLSPPETTR